MMLSRNPVFSGTSRIGLHIRGHQMYEGPALHEFRSQRVCLPGSPGHFSSQRVPCALSFLPSFLCPRLLCRQCLLTLPHFSGIPFSLSWPSRSERLGTSERCGAYKEENRGVQLHFHCLLSSLLSLSFLEKLWVILQPFRQIVKDRFFL